MEILVLEHEQESHVCLLGEWASERGHVLRLLDVPSLAYWPEPEEADAIVSLGSDESVHASGERWIAEEVSFLRDAHGAGVPVLGICFGAQALAAALGGDVTRATFVEVGWTPLVDHDAELLPPGPWFRWHEDVFSTPPGAREIARSPAGPLAFVLDESIGLQFHPEVDEALVREWIAGARRQLTELPVDEHALLREISAGAEGATARAAKLFDQIAARWATACENRTGHGERGAKSS
jgi:GMP synthase-like glutamine amidotransferase